METVFGAIFSGSAWSSIAEFMDGPEVISESPVETVVVTEEKQDVSDNGSWQVVSVLNEAADSDRADLTQASVELENDVMYGGDTEVSDTVSERSEPDQDYAETYAGSESTLDDGTDNDTASEISDFEPASLSPSSSASDQSYADVQPSSSVDSRSSADVQTISEEAVVQPVIVGRAVLNDENYNGQFECSEFFYLDLNNSGAWDGSFDEQLDVGFPCVSEQEPELEAVVVAETVEAEVVEAEEETIFSAIPRSLIMDSDLQFYDQHISFVSPRSTIAAHWARHDSTHKPPAPTHSHNHPPSVAHVLNGFLGATWPDKAARDAPPHDDMAPRHHARHVWGHDDDESPLLLDDRGHVTRAMWPVASHGEDGSRVMTFRTPRHASYDVDHSTPSVCFGPTGGSDCISPASHSDSDPHRHHHHNHHLGGLAAAFRPPHRHLDSDSDLGRGSDLDDSSPPTPASVGAMSPPMSPPARWRYFGASEEGHDMPVEFIDAIEFDAMTADLLLDS